ncbi:MAG: permease of phosphate ABC transporter [Ruminococcaceae bacterium]|nr:permease of phosphate ABC transporter [Oscillospiraceae bacterium]
MKTLFKSADEYLKLSSWKDLAFIKFCLFSMGVLMGTYIKRDAKQNVRIAAFFVFLATYIPLMVKYAMVLVKTINDGRKAL